MAFWNLRARVALLWLIITLLVVGVVAWAISAEVVMAAMRDAVKKNSDISSMRLHQNFDTSDTSDDFSIHRVHNRIGDSAKKSSLRNSETTLIRQVDKQTKSKNKPKSDDSVYSYDDKYDETFTSGEEDEEALESVAVIKRKVSTTKKPSNKSSLKDKPKKEISKDHFAEVISQLMAQAKIKDGNDGQIVVVAPTQASPKKLKNSKTSQTSTTSKKSLKSAKAMTTSTTTTTTTTTTTRRPTTTRTTTTIKPFYRSRIQSLSLKLSNSAITTTKPKRTKIKVSTIKIRRTTTTTKPSTTTTIRTTTTRKPTTTKQSRSRTRKTSLKSFKNIVSKTTTTESPITTMNSSQMEKLKSKIRQKELEFLLNKVESLEKQQKDLLRHSESETMVSSESNSRDNFVKPNIEVIPFNNKYPEYSFGHSGHSSKPSYEMKSRPSNGWQPSNRSPVHSSHLPPPLPPVPYVPPPPPPPPFHGPDNHNMMGHQMSPSHHHMLPPPPPQPAFSEPQGMRHIMDKPLPEPNRFRNQHLMNGVIPVPNSRGVSLGGAEPQVPQESHPMPYHMKGPPIRKTEKPGIQLSFGGGPMGGGGQLKTSPMGIFKTLLLPLLPKPRMNLNGKVVFGVVLENGVGFGKKPKVVAQHFSTGHI